MTKEKLFVVLVTVCILAIVLFMIGGAVQDIDYHTELTDPSLKTEDALKNDKADYERLQARKALGEKMQLVGALFALVGFAAVTVFSLRVAHTNAKKAEAKYKKSE